MSQLRSSLAFLIRPIDMSEKWARFLQWKARLEYHLYKTFADLRLMFRIARIDREYGQIFLDIVTHFTTLYSDVGLWSFLIS